MAFPPQQFTALGMPQLSQNMAVWAYHTFILWGAYRSGGACTRAASRSAAHVPAPGHACSVAGHPRALSDHG
ncbi:hypothetical protein HJFPF1_01132 [Paramyrothecium foliicola]|nr:hypothetical protein HJFPF1_01132 [Paramyrothecium foliicola]